MAWVNQVTHMRTFHRGDPLYLPGDPSDRVYFLKAGRVKVARLSEEGKEITLAILKPGDTIGETCIVDGTPRETVALALDEVSVCTMGKDDLERLMQIHPGLSLKLTKLIGLRLRRIENKVEELVFRDVHSRLARLLLQLVEEYGEPAPEGAHIRARMTHQEMANLVGATRETVTVTLNDLKRQGLIDLQGRTVVIRDREGLQAYG